MSYKTADLCDNHIEKLQVAENIFRDFGGRKTFSGHIVTVKVFEDNSLVRTALESDGNGKVLVVDGGGSLRCALVGGLIAFVASLGETGATILLAPPGFRTIPVALVEALGAEGPVLGSARLFVAADRRLSVAAHASSPRGEPSAYHAAPETGAAAAPVHRGLCMPR